MPIEHDSVTSVHRMAYTTSSDPGAVGAYVGWIDTNTTPHILKVRNAGNSAWVQVGEIPTASNLGAGSSVFKQKTGQNLEFRKLKSTSNIIVTQNADDINITVDETLLNPTLVVGHSIESFLLSQSGTAHPTQLNVINQFGDALWTRTNTGIYNAFFSGSLPVGQTLCTATYGTNTNDPTVDGMILSCYRVDASNVELRSYNVAGALADLNADLVSVVMYIES